MKLKLLLSFLLAFGTVVAGEAEILAQSVMNEPEVKQGFGYFSTGIGHCLHLLSGCASGYRMQSGHHGADLSLQMTGSYVTLPQLKTNLLYHHYFKPSLNSQFYVGGGVGSGVLLSASPLFGGGWDKIYLFSPEFVFGKQYRNESNNLRFFQMQVSLPMVALGKHAHCMEARGSPLVVISYGIGF